MTDLAERLTSVWAKAKALQEFHGTTHNEKDHGKRGADSFEYISDRSSKFHTIVAKKGGKVVGKLEWSKKHGRIHSIDVDPDHQREGIATALWEAANERPGMKPKHSPDRTNAGDAWARSVSSRLPARAAPTMSQILETSGAGPGQGRRGPFPKPEPVVPPIEFHGATHNEKSHGRRFRNGDTPLGEYLQRMRNRPSMGVPGIYTVSVFWTDRSKETIPGEYGRTRYKTRESVVEVEAQNEDDAKEQAHNMVQSRGEEGMVLEQRVTGVKPHQTTPGNTSVVGKDAFKVTKQTDTPAPGADNPLAVRAGRGESGTEPERRIPHRGETVDIYRDLGRGREFKRGFPDKAAFSVRNAASVDGNSSALVRASTVGIVLDQPRPAWAASAKRQAEATGVRGVHAFIRGEVSEYLSPDEASELISQPGWQEVTYYPGSEDFFDPKTRRRFLTAQKAVGVNGKFYVMGPEFHETTAPVGLLERKIQASLTASADLPDDLEWWYLHAGRLIELWATAKALQEFHLESHNEKDHGRRGVNKVTKKGTDKVFVPTVKKKGSTPAAPPPPPTPAEKKAAFVPTVKKKEAPPTTQVEAPRTPDLERPTLTPPAEKASVSPVTTDLASKSPSEIDTELFPLWAARWTAAMHRHGYQEQIDRHNEAVAGTYKPKSRFESDPKMTDHEVAWHQKRVDKYQAEIDAINVKIQPFEDEFKKRGGWERFDFVPDGHLHKRGCHTLYPTTDRLILAEASGKTDQWIVDNFAYAACTVCFPAAPVEAREKYLSDRKKANAAEREAKAVARREKEAAKNLVKPVELKGWRQRVVSVYDAKSALKSEIENEVWDTESKNSRWEPEALAQRKAERAEDIRALSEALDLKGLDVEAMIAKWRKQAEKDMN